MAEYIKKEDVLALAEKADVNENFDEEIIFAYNVRELPPANDVRENIKGEWIIHGKTPAYILECSQCGQRHINYAMCPLPNYCSHCGAYNMRQ